MMIQVQKQIQNCIAQIIQHKLMLQNVFAEIYAQGGRVLLVGGAVRDCLLGQFSLDTDLDFEVYHLSLIELEEILKQFKPVSLVGKSFGVLRMHGINADWSIPRKDSSGRKPIVELDPHMSFEQAFKRRDLTVNAMGIDVHSKELIDPYKGLDDLKDKILRAPDVKFFVEDPLRLFRVMQFVARLQMETDKELDEICKTMDISTVSSERIEQEFKKLFLRSKKPSLGLIWLQKIGRLHELFTNLIEVEKLYKAVDCAAQIYNITDTEKLAAIWSCFVYVCQNNSVAALELINKDIKAQAKQCIKWYTHSHEVLDQAVALGLYVSYVPMLAQDRMQSNCKWLAYWLLPDISLYFLSCVALCWYDKKIVQQFVIQAQRSGVLHAAEAPLITGKDLLHITKGKELGDLIEKAYQIQINENIFDKSVLLSKVIKK